MKSFELEEAGNKLRGQLTSGFLSKHLGTDQKYNERNDGIGYIHPSGWMGGAYKNSIGKNSLYFGREFTTPVMGGDAAGLDAGVIAGAVTGYKNPLMPLLLPELIARFGDNRLAFGLVPEIKGVTPATIALQYRKKF